MFLLIAALLLLSCTRPPESEKTIALPDDDPAALEAVGQLQLTRARAIALSGRRGFVARNFDGLSEIDLSTPCAPRLIRTIAPTVMQPLDVVESRDGRYLFLADRFRGFVTVRSDTLTTCGALALDGIATKISLFARNQKHFAAVACGGGGLQIVDVSDPLSPKVASSFVLGTDYATDAAVAGSLVFLANNDEGGLEMFSLPEPPVPKPLVRISLPGYCVAVDVAAPLFSAALRNGGFAILRTTAFRAAPSETIVTTPSIELLSLVSKFPDYVQDVCFLPNDHIAVANNENGVQVYDISDPTLPRLKDSQRVDGEAVALRWQEPYLYVCAWDGGLVIMRLVRRQTPQED